MFERLTDRTGNGQIYLIDGSEEDMYGYYTGKGLGQMEKVIDRLAAYEDSGLSPEEVRELAKAKADGRLVVLDDRLAISMCAGARAIEQNINRMGKIYVYDVHKGEPKIAYLEAARVLRETAETAIVEVGE